MAFQVPVVFNDVVASFTVEQWINLAGWKKELYHNVVKDIHKILKKQGYTIINPDVLFNIQKTDESCIRIDSSLAEREPDVVRDVPDLLLRIKEESAEEAHCSTEKPKIKEERDTALPPKSCPVITSVVSLSIKEEQMACDEVVKVSVPSKTNPPEVQDGSMFFIKQEEEVYSIDDYNTVGLETTVQETSSPTVTIKQEFDPLHQIKQEETRGYPDIIPVVVKEEEGEPMEEISTTVSSAAALGRLSSKADCEPSYRYQTSNYGEMDTSSDIEEIPLDYSSVSREQQKQILLAQMREALQSSEELPCFPYNPQKSAKELEEEKCEILVEESCVGKTDWCSCGLCIKIPSEEESLCCQEVRNLRKHLTSDSDCITRHERFHQFCLDEEMVYLIFRTLGTYTSRPAEWDYNRKLRKTAFRSFTCWIHEFLGARNSRPIPACVVNSIRKKFPDPENVSFGFIRLQDYAAVDMADDL
ncbi:P2X purinoceptor 7-like [Pelobates cultripes]|uniref:P2X purinoceptor 7-like n=1 Tax=Pelobates cultripes TaxID=61616 RepID=A0AAD1TBZ7_PELCU|nr:P2X purinoceptor 7-like [Pelobates cultripes]